jgi:hypothetical protein
MPGGILSHPISKIQALPYPFSVRKHFINRGLTFCISIKIVLFIVLTAPESAAQIYSQKWSAGIHTGMLVFYGDIKTNEFLPSVSGFNELRAGGGVQATYHFNPVLAIRGSLLVGRLAGANPDLDEYFTANIMDYTLQGLISLNSLFFYGYDFTPVDIYAIAGYGLVEFRTIKRRLSDDTFIRAFGYNTDGSKSPKKTRELVIPLGMKVHADLETLFGSSNTFLSNSTITFEFLLYNANTNKLDADLTVREVKDKYSYLSLGLLYYFR